MEARLIIVGGKAGKKQIRLKLPSVIGRSREADLTIAHPMVSRQHCELYEAQGLLRIRDLGSLNGTFIGDKQISEAALRPSDEFTVGPLTFRVDYDYAGDPTAESPSVPDFHLGTASAQPVEIGGPAVEGSMFMEPAPPVSSPADGATNDFVAATAESPPPLFGQSAPQESQETPEAAPAEPAYPDFSAWDQPVEQPAPSVAEPAMPSPSTVEEEEEKEPDPTPPPPYPRPQRSQPQPEAAAPQQPQVVSADQADENGHALVPAPVAEAGDGPPAEVAPAESVSLAPDATVWMDAPEAAPAEEVEPLTSLAAPASAVAAVPAIDQPSSEPSSPPPVAPQPAAPAEKKRGWLPFRREKEKAKPASQAASAAVPAAPQTPVVLPSQGNDEAPDFLPQQEPPTPGVDIAPAAAETSPPPADSRVPPVQIQPPGQAQAAGEDGLDPELDAFLRGFE